MRMRRLVGLLFAGALAAGLSTGIGAAAQAAPVAPAANAVTPAPATFYEIFPPFINPTSPKCIDVPSASTRIGQPLQLFHCKSSSNQLWEFFNMGNNVYQIQNRNSGLCLEVPTFFATDGTLIEQSTCTGTSDVEWQLSSPVEVNHFNMISVEFPNLCMAAANNSGADHTPVVLQTCNPGNIFNENQLQTWQLG